MFTKSADVIRDVIVTYDVVCSIGRRVKRVSPPLKRKKGPTVEPKRPTGSDAMLSRAPRLWRLPASDSRGRSHNQR